KRPHVAVPEFVQNAVTAQAAQSRRDLARERGLLRRDRVLRWLTLAAERRTSRGDCHVDVSGGRIAGMFPGSIRCHPNGPRSGVIAGRTGSDDDWHDGFLAAASTWDLQIGQVGWDVEALAAGIGEANHNGAPLGAASALPI